MPKREKLCGLNTTTTIPNKPTAASHATTCAFTSDVTGGRYRPLSRPEKLSRHVDDLEEACRLLKVAPGRVFPNIEMIEEKNDLVYFDARSEGARRWAPPIQAWMELALSGPREREAAQILEAILIKGEADTLP